MRAIWIGRRSSFLLRRNVKSHLEELETIVKSLEPEGRS